MRALNKIKECCLEFKPAPSSFSNAAVSVLANIFVA